ARAAVRSGRGGPSAEPGHRLPGPAAAAPAGPGCRTFSLADGPLRSAGLADRVDKLGRCCMSHVIPVDSPLSRPPWESGAAHFLENPQVVRGVRRRAPDPSGTPVVHAGPGAFGPPGVRWASVEEIGCNM